MPKYEERITENCLRDAVGLGSLHVIPAVTGMGVAAPPRRSVIPAVGGNGSQFMEMLNARSDSWRKPLHELTRSPFWKTTATNADV